MAEIFEFKDYKDYLVARLGPSGKRSGTRAALASHIGCQTAYISQVLSGTPHLSIEQAFKANEFLGHDKQAGDYFLLLVQKARAGTKELESYFQAKLNEIVGERTKIKNRLKNTQAISKEDQNRYYSNWAYAACHVALSVPELQTKEALAKRFKLPLPIVADIVEFLVASGLATNKGERYLTGPNHLHLAGDSENILKHHTNWRLQALKSLDQYDPTGHELHYAVTYSISREDALVLKEKIIRLIKDNLEVVGPSKEETLFCNVIDFFEI